MSRELNEARKRTHDATATQNYFLELFGDELAVRLGYEGLDGMEAVQFYLMEKHHWLPSVVRSMSGEDLRFAMTKEMAGWKVKQAT